MAQRSVRADRRTRAARASECSVTRLGENVEEDLDAVRRDLINHLGLEQHLPRAGTRSRPWACPVTAYGS